MGKSIRTNNNDLVIFDVGARFGIHPTNTQLVKCATHVLIDSDIREIRRLQDHYRALSNVTCITNCVTSPQLAAEFANMPVNIVAHPGGNSVLTPESEHAYWKEIRPGTGNVVGTEIVPTTTVDAIARKLQMSPRYMKVDVEGHEFEVLLGAENSLATSILGLRVEVIFTSLYKNHGPTFGRVTSYLAELGFDFLNFSLMTNSLVPFFPYFDDRQPYGQLMGCDAIYTRSLEHVLTRSNIEIIDFALFCMNNGSPDFGIRVLIEATKDRPTLVTSFEESELASLRAAILEQLVAQYFFGLKDRSAMSLDTFKDAWRQIFASEWVQHGEFYERYPIS